MKQVLLKGRQSLVLQDTKECVSCDKDEVIIQVKAVTICGSDISYFKAEKIPHNLSYPLVLGHEVAGIVKETGENVSHVNVGDKVAVEPDQYCGNCKYCRNGHYNFCESLKFMASKGTEGALQEFLRWSAKSVYKLPESMSFEDGALLEPLSVAYSAIEKLELKADANIAVLGAGSIGLLIGLLIQTLYPTVRFYIADQYEEKKQLGIQAGISKEHFLIDTITSKVAQFTHIIDTTGVTKLIHDFILHSEYGVRVILVGVSEQKVDLSCKALVYQGVQLIGSYRYAHTYPKLIKLFEEKELCVNAIITKRYQLENAQAAFEEAMDNKHNIKVAIQLP